MKQGKGHYVNWDSKARDESVYKIELLTIRTTSTKNAITCTHECTENCYLVIHKYNTVNIT